MSKGGSLFRSFGHQPLNTTGAEVREQVPGGGWSTVLGTYHM